MKLPDKAIDTINKIHLMTGESKNTVRSIFESLITLIILNKFEQDKTYFPYLGEVSLIEDNKKISLQWDELDNILIKSYNQILNKQESIIEKMFKSRITHILEQYINE